MLRPNLKKKSINVPFGFSYLIKGSRSFLLRLGFRNPKISMSHVTWLPFWLHPETGSPGQYWQPFRGCWGDPDRFGWHCSTVLHSHKPQLPLCIYKKYLVQTNFLNTVTFGGKMSVMFGTLCSFIGGSFFFFLNFVFHHKDYQKPTH